MPSKDVLKEAIKAFDGTAIIVSHDREFLDGLVTKVYEFGGGRVREHLGGIYDFLRNRSEYLEVRGERIDFKAEKPASQPQASQSQISQPQDTSLTPDLSLLTSKLSYAEHKEQQKRLKRAEKAVKESEAKIEKMEARLKELDDLLMVPENASDMTLVTEYTTTKRCLDEEMERWERLSEELASQTSQ